MKSSNPKPINSLKSNSSLTNVNEVKSLPRKGPVSFLSGALTSGLMAWVCLIISQKVVLYFTNHSLHYTSAIAESVASGFKTLIIGISFLATFTFAFIGLGLSLVFIRSLFDANQEEST